MNNYLYHHGRKGMKWGEHIFSEQKDKGSYSERVTKGASKGVEGARRIVDRFPKKKRSYDLSSMSDSELRSRINRINLERQYSDILNSDLYTGREKAKEVLDVVGGIVGIAGGIATVGTSIYGIRKLMKENK